MGALLNTIGGLGRPLVLGVVILIVFGLLSSDPTSGNAGDGFSCWRITSDPELNRLLCQYSPARIWNMPLADLLPEWAAGSFSTK